MEWNLDKKRSLSTQIYEHICLGIAKGVFKPGERLLSVRDIAVVAGVNPNTVQSSFNTLEADGILYSVRGSGWYVAEDVSKAKQNLKSLQKEKTAAFFADMEKLGMTAEETKNYIKEWEI